MSHQIIAQGLLDSYNKQQVDSFKSKPREGYIKPSSLGCFFKMAYEYEGIVPPEVHIEARNVDIMQSGSDRHERIQSVIRDIPEFDWKLIRDNPELLTNPNVKIDKYDEIFEDEFETLLHYEKGLLKARFKADGILYYGDHKFLLEIKTIGSRYYKDLTAPKEDHIRQITFYSAMYGIRDIIFVYEDRDSLNKKVFNHTVTEYDIKKLYDTIIKHVKKEVTITRGHMNKLCDFCGYKSICEKKVTEEPGWKKRRNKTLKK